VVYVKQMPILPQNIPRQNTHPCVATRPSRGPMMGSGAGTGKNHPNCVIGLWLHTPKSPLERGFWRPQACAASRDLPAGTIFPAQVHLEGKIAQPPDGPPARCSAGLDGESPRLCVAASGNHHLFHIQTVRKEPLLLRAGASGWGWPFLWGIADARRQRSDSRPLSGAHRLQKLFVAAGALHPLQQKFHRFHRIEVA